jgi:hypothetical protein
MLQRIGILTSGGDAPGMNAVLQARGIEGLVVIGGNGSLAVRGLLAGATRKMAAWMPPVELPAEVGARSPADPYCWLVDLGAVIAETDNLLKGKSPLARWRAGAFEQIEDALLL